MQRLIRLFSLGFAALVLFVGCDDDGRMKTYPVSGRVVFEDGTPLKGGTVLCMSESAETTLSARGTIAEDGSFTLGTYEGDDGAIAGSHLVAIDPPMPENYNPDDGPAPRIIHPRFQRHRSSGLMFEVTSGEPNEVTLEVSRK